MRRGGWIIPSMGIFCICVMQMWAMAHGHDGVILTMSVTAIAGISGYQLKGGAKPK